MINKKTNLIIITYLFFVWAFPILINAEWGKFAFTIIYGALILAIIFVKPKSFRWFFCVCFAFVICYLIYDNTMLFLFINPFFITIEYISIFKEKMSETSVFPGANISATIGFFYLIYVYFNDKNEYFLPVNPSSFLIIFAIVLFLSLVVAMGCLKTKKKFAKHYHFSITKFQQLKYIHIMNIFCYLESIIFFCLINNTVQEFNERAYFLPWLIYIVVMLNVKDPYIDIMSKNLKSHILQKDM